MRCALILPLIATPAAALTPLPPCSPVFEADMYIGDVQMLGGYEAQSGVTVESYSNRQVVVDTVYTDMPGPVAQLDDFAGVRVLMCATGDFVAIPRVGADQVNTALSATEFLRSAVQSGQRVTFGQVQRAAKAVFGDVIRLRESEQTCACNTYFPDLKPASMTAFGARTDIE